MLSLRLKFIVPLSVEEFCILYSVLVFSRLLVGKCRRFIQRCRDGYRDGLVNESALYTELKNYFNLEIVIGTVEFETDGGTLYSVEELLGMILSHAKQQAETYAEQKIKVSTDYFLLGQLSKRSLGMLHD